MTSQERNPQDEFAQEFISNQGKLYGYIATLLPHRDDAEDVLQRTSLILWQKWEQFDNNRGFLPWARGIALNEIRNLLRRSERRNVHLSEPIIAMLADELDEDQNEDRVEALTFCLDRLEEKQRNLLERCYLGSNGVKTVASAMNSSAASIYMRLHRMRRMLVDCINKRLSNEMA